MKNEVTTWTSTWQRHDKVPLIVQAYGWDRIKVAYAILRGKTIHTFIRNDYLTKKGQNYFISRFEKEA